MSIRVLSTIGIRSKGKSIVSGSSLLSGIVSYWKLDESSGNAIDSADGNDGTPTSITYSVSGKINTAYQFAGNPVGAGSNLDMGNPSNLQLTTSGSISAWVYQTDNSFDQQIVCKGNPGGDVNGYIFVLLSGGAFNFELADASSHQINYGGAISLNNWHHLVATWDANVSLYVDGTIVSGYPVARTVTPISNVYNFMIGERPDTGERNGFTGKIDEVGVWNRELTSTEVTSLYNSNTGLSYPF